ncbi:hypothetical protein OZX69_02910 [Lactobacillus sp. ESL0731]|uniref:hypothetical protein n=1 Tax=unclassified Lactobacillus TaxID=2620435 RepID=UPI0023F9D3C1|nr:MULTISPECIES: hypothetical protein [unclassified Lactobacillus]WEV51660.1 hypothetical protein OZX63_02910 [Lactobacillus sp. ESL0700]WEV62789.1 hypothetical protein OZX69_02910 [Lactobacillus sp. ESL0731]
MKTNSIVRLNDGRTSYHVKETMKQIMGKLSDTKFIKLTDQALGPVLINISNIISVTNYDKYY